MWKLFMTVVLLLALFLTAEATLCYQCDSWTHRDCGEDDYLYDRDREFLVPCSPTSYSSVSGQYQTAPQTCLKEVTHFLHDKNAPVLDPYHRYNRPHVLRHCGISINPAYTRGDDYNYDRDRCVKTEAVVNGIRAERWICSCTGDGCNSAFSFMKASSISIFALLGLHVFFVNLTL